MSNTMIQIQDLQQDYQLTELSSAEEIMSNIAIYDIPENSAIEAEEAENIRGGVALSTAAAVIAITSATYNFATGYAEGSNY